MNKAYLLINILFISFVFAQSKTEQHLPIVNDLPCGAIEQTKLNKKEEIEIRDFNLKVSYVDSLHATYKPKRMCCKVKTILRTPKFKEPKIFEKEVRGSYIKETILRGFEAIDMSGLCKLMTVTNQLSSRLDDALPLAASWKSQNIATSKYAPKGTTPSNDEEWLKVTAQECNYVCN